jgi:two-component system sensor histidine kinase KdpD
MTGSGARIERMRDEDLLDGPVPTASAPSPGISGRRRLLALALAATGLPLLTLVLDGTTSTLSLEGEVLLYLLAVVLLSLMGGMVVALVSAVAAALLINFFFVAPRHTLEVAQADQAVALVVFVAVAAIVSAVVEVAARRARLAEQAGRAAQTLSELAAAGHDEADTLRGILAKARETFGMESVTLLARDRPSGEWREIEAAGWAPPGDEQPKRFDVPAGARLRLVGRGPALFAEDQRVLHAFAGAVQNVYEGQRLGEEARQARALADIDRQRTALLAAVGHDLRTPLAAIKASVTTLRQTDVPCTDEERDALLATIEEGVDRLDGVVGNLLDASRLRAGVVSVQARPVALDEVVGAALVALPAASTRVVVSVPDDLPLVRADPGLLERVFVNLIDNALRHGGADGPIEITAHPGAQSTRVEVVDHGAGLAPEERERLFTPFGPGGDRADGGLGLGLSVARGFVEAMDGAMTADPTPGGGLTMRMRLPLATPAGDVR